MSTPERSSDAGDDATVLGEAAAPRRDPKYRKVCDRRMTDMLTRQGMRCRKRLLNGLTLYPHCEPIDIRMRGAWGDVPYLILSNT